MFSLSQFDALLLESTLEVNSVAFLARNFINENNSCRITERKRDYKYQSKLFQEVSVITDKFKDMYQEMLEIILQDKKLLGDKLDEELLKESSDEDLLDEEEPLKSIPSSEFGDISPLLEKREWLNDNCIDAFVSLISSQPEFREKNTIILSSAWFSFLNSWSGNGEAKCERILSKKLNKSKTQVSKIIIPICYEDHWICCEIDISNLSVKTFNSLSYSTSKSANIAGRKIQKFFESSKSINNILINIFKTPTCSPEFSLTSAKCAQQENAYDCGVYVCLNILALTLSKTPDCEPRFLRNRLFNAIIHQDLKYLN
ncbi:unnamed protein product [Moneuplotes crassus]|uniref:Ubiquitin-like protease family profile domain-containing protein n=1 Tax=Euplotes crassus TaxID=5936 RepID=A0AAD1XMX4_EUPCR|nr:unnamed protein product [Moneuplotes crassus]